MQIQLSQTMLPKQPLKQNQNKKIPRDRIIQSGTVRSALWATDGVNGAATIIQTPPGRDENRVYRSPCPVRPALNVGVRAAISTVLTEDLFNCKPVPFYSNIWRTVGIFSPASSFMGFVFYTFIPS